MYERIMTVANMGVVTAADFAPFLGQRSYFTVDAEDLPKTGDHWADQMPGVCEFEVSHIYPRTNEVLIHYWVGQHDRAVKWLIDPDELAIRMEDA